MERLTAQDLSMLWPDDFGWPQDIGVLAVLDGARLLGPDGSLRIEAVRNAVGRRLHLVPRLRTFARPVAAFRDAREAWPAVHETFAERAPRTSLNRPIGSGRRLAIIRSNVDLAKQIAHTHEAKLNDVLMTAGPDTCGTSPRVPDRRSDDRVASPGPGRRSRTLRDTRPSPRREIRGKLNALEVSTIVTR